MNSIKELCIEVREYYLRILDTLPVEKQFHFLSRAYLWTGKAEYYRRLLAIREKWWDGFKDACEKLDALPHSTRESHPRKGKKYRRAHKAVYGDIVAYNRFFFMCLFDETIFNGSAFEESEHHLPRVRHQELYEKLLVDHDALHTLATPAVNFLLLSYHFVKGLKSPYESLALALQKEGELAPLDNADATVYFAHHVIIGSSLFYSKSIPATLQTLCEGMLSEAEKVIETYYDNMSIDHKCEFLVCAELCGQESRLKARIQDELEASRAPNAPYFINTQNSHTRSHIPTPNRKEHSNILALMAFLGSEAL